MDDDGELWKSGITDYIFLRLESADDEEAEPCVVISPLPAVYLRLLSPSFDSVKTRAAEALGTGR